MVFETGNRYVITSILSNEMNPIHDDMRGRICEIESLDKGDIGWLTVQFEDGKWHMIHTSRIENVEIADSGNEIIVKTRNSVYTFSMMTDDGGDKDAA